MEMVNCEATRAWNNADIRWEGKTPEEFMRIHKTPLQKVAGPVDFHLDHDEVFGRVLNAIFCAPIKFIKVRRRA